MRNVGNHGLQCPEPDDYAAAALFMQNLGTLIDAQLQSELDSLNAFLDRPTIILTVAANRSVAAGNVVTDLFDTVVFNNSTFMNFRADVPNTSTYIDIGSQVGAITTVPYLRGVYSVGLCTRQTAAGAVDAYTKRIAQVFLEDQSLPFQPIVTFLQDTTFDTNTGGNEAQNIKDSVTLSRTSGIVVKHQVGNTNVASAVNVLAGALLWVTYEGPTDIIEVA